MTLPPVLARLWARLPTAPPRRRTWILAMVAMISLVVDLVYALTASVDVGRTTPLHGRHTAVFHTPAGPVSGHATLPGEVRGPNGASGSVVTVTVPVTIPPGEESWGLLISRPLNGLDVRWDGTPLPNGNVASRAGRTEGGGSFIGRVPDALARPGVHTVEIDMRPAFGMTGVFGEVRTGPFETVRDLHASHELHMVLLTAILHAAAVLWVAIALIRPRRSEFLWGGIMWGSLGVYYFTQSDAWSLGLSSLTVRIQVRESAGAAAAIAALMFTSTFPPTTPRARPWLVGGGLFAYLVAVALPLHGDLPLASRMLTPLGIVTMLASLSWYWAGARAGNPVARALIAANTVPFVMYLTLLFRNPMMVDWLVLPSLAFLVVATTIILVAHHAALSDRYEHLVARARDAVVVARRDGTVLEANREAQALFGLEPGVRTLAQGGSMAGLRDHLRTGADGRRLDLELPSRDGGARVVESVAVDLDDSEVLLVARDVTGRASAERSLVHVARMETVGVLASGLVHDLNNTLTGLLAHVDSLRVGASPEDLARLDRIVEAILRAARMGRHVATLVRDGASPEGPQDPGPIVRDTAAWIVNAHPRRVHLHLDVAEALPWVHARTTDIEQILVNLVGNAVRASPTDGTVRVAAHSDGVHLHLTVEDEGGGVPPEARARVWEPFFTTRPDGTGIGLAVVSRIARDLGGDVALEDGARGARFRVSLPHAPGRRPERPRVALLSADTARHARLRAMLVDRGFDVEEPGGRHDGVVVIDAPDDVAMEAAQPWLSRAPATVCVFVRPASARGEPSPATCLHEPLDAECLAAGVRQVLFSRQANAPKSTTAPVA
ncbi:MAG: hypothetical protein RLZZ299_3026 [Pseudomonadota bacterium]